MFIKCFLLLSAINFLSAGRVPQPEERIIGGKDIEIEDAPWQVAILYRGRQYCGGSIYSKDIIITAAHCRFDEKGKMLKTKYIQVRVGSSLANSNGTLIQVAAIKSHEDYPDPLKNNDIAVMRLSKPLQFSSKVQAIPLAERNPSPGTLAMAFGWGAVKVTPSVGKDILEPPKQLQGIDLQVQNCWKYFNDISGENICVKSPRQSTCRGDSGGPLVVDKQLVGVTSWGPAYCNDFAVFTGVPYFRNWILNAIDSVLLNVD
ncbi:trypsin alpha-like [Drosophila ficusphila]|uniref:trypsin alpha-like n=1 Tax=Drosophila ficusphila TaxID=30025 RepID=UPI001C890537|nr:trypsin alpha-like [Drosophila ficusphila]